MNFLSPAINSSANNFFRTPAGVGKKVFVNNLTSGRLTISSNQA